jgi:hypothetical protein
MELGLTLTHLSFIFLCKQGSSTLQEMHPAGTSEQIVNRLEQMYESGRRLIQPDMSFAGDALDQRGTVGPKGKSLKCLDL